MTILFWLLPAVVVTAAAMLWVGWVGRERPAGPDRSDAAQERFAAAIRREHPAGVRVRPGGRERLRERSTGVAVRRSSTGPRRSA